MICRLAAAKREVLSQVLSEVSLKLAWMMQRPSRRDSGESVDRGGGGDHSPRHSVATTVPSSSRAAQDAFMRSSLIYLIRSVSGCAFMFPALLPLLTKLFLCVFEEIGRGPRRSLSAVSTWADGAGHIGFVSKLNVALKFKSTFPKLNELLRIHKWRCDIFFFYLPCESRQQSLFC